MPKKLTMILLALLLCLTTTAQAEETENPMEFTGYWLDAWSGRANLTITFDGEEHKAVIHWANSAFDSIEWTMSGLFTDGVLTDENSVKRYVAYDEAGVREETVLYAGQKAALTLTDGAFIWTEPEGMGADCRFERYEEIDLSDVFNPEHYAHLYVTGTSEISGTLCVKGCLGTIHENGSIEGFDLRESLMLPLSSESDVRLKDGSADLSAHFASQQVGFYAIVRISETGEIVTLQYNEDQPNAPEQMAEEIPLAEAMVAPAPPTRK